jgi:hypothetical protein
MPGGASSQRRAARTDSQSLGVQPLSDASAWARRGSTVAIAPLVACTLAACTLAAWGHVRYAPLVARPTLYVLPAA